MTIAVHGGFCKMPPWSVALLLRASRDAGVACCALRHQQHFLLFEHNLSYKLCGGVPYCVINRAQVSQRCCDASLRISTPGNLQFRTPCRHFAIKSQPRISR